MTEKADGGGLRYDTGKRRPDLIPPEAEAALAQLYAIGARKYAARNWERGMPYSKVLGPLKRHLQDWELGHTWDKETGTHHLINVAWNAIALYCYEVWGIGEDDLARGKSLATPLWHEPELPIPPTPSEEKK